MRNSKQVWCRLDLVRHNRELRKANFLWRNNVISNHETLYIFYAGLACTYISTYKGIYHLWNTKWSASHVIRIIPFLTASLPTQSKELLRHYHQPSRHLPNFKHITSCLTRNDAITSNDIMILSILHHV